MVRYIATIDATHAGFVNDNNTWYLEDHMEAAVDTWVTPFNKPILTHHNKTGDAIGYVIDAKYIQTPQNGGSNAPRGHIQLRAVISDINAVQKIRDGRYNTVSIGADVTSAVCSICDHNIADNGLCEHRRGKVYDGKKCFWHLGGIKYNECSYVNTPADQYASTLRMDEETTTGMPVENSHEDEKKTLKLKFTFDSEDVVIEKEGELVPVVDSITTEDDTWNDYTEDDLAMAHWLMVELDSELAEDAKLSTEKRAKLPSSAFCGPNKSFPVNDCAHVTAARRLIGRYKGPGNKTKILACVNSKAKSMSCDSNKSNDSQTKTNREELMELTLQDILSRDDVKNHIATVIAEKDTQLSGMKALDEKVQKLEQEATEVETEVTSLKDNVTKLETANEELTAKVHMNLVDTVFNLRSSLQKKDVMDLKDDKETQEYKTVLATRSDESLTDSINDLEKEEPVQPITKTINASDSGDEVKDDKSTDDKTTVEVKDHKVTRVKQVEDLILGSDNKETQTEE